MYLIGGLMCNLVFLDSIFRTIAMKNVQKFDQVCFTEVQLVIRGVFSKMFLLRFFQILLITGVLPRNRLDPKSYEFAIYTNLKISENDVIYDGKRTRHL